jgi:monofunctional biosynthetic peptidoglycan transglycosylase
LTPLMVIRAIEGEGIRKDWQPYAAISPHLVRAVMASEDTRFCQHHGFDWREIENALAASSAGERLRGASTISMQTAKNLFLWPGRSYLRKAVEAYFTVLLELFWSKKRIIETYLNVVEWGSGIYGAQAAAEAHFGKSAAALTRREASLLAAVLPNPRRWSASHPTRYILNRSATIRARMRNMPDPESGPCE